MSQLVAYLSLLRHTIVPLYTHIHIHIYEYECTPLIKIIGSLLNHTNLKVPLHNLNFHIFKYLLIWVNLILFCEWSVPIILKRGVGLYILLFTYSISYWHAHL